MGAKSSDKTPGNVAKVRFATILFADLLGFSKRVTDATTEEETFDLAARLAHFAERISGRDYEDQDIQTYFDKKYWAFSDSIVVCWYRGSEAQRSMTDFDADLVQLSGVALAQAMIMQRHRQLVRGGVAQGWFLEQGNTVLGTALVSAARIEKAIEMPFIGVDAELYEHYAKHRVRAQYAKDIDPIAELFVAPCEYTRGLPALDYFMAMLNTIDLTGPQIIEAKALPSGEAREDFMNTRWTENRRSYVEWHRDFITKGLTHTDARVQEKYRALKLHHNARVISVYRDPSSLIVA